MMKIINIFITVLLFLASTAPILAQNRQKIGLNPGTLNGSAVLELESTTKGFLPPRMTYLQRRAILSPGTGLMLWCTNCGIAGEMQVYSGSAWLTADKAAAAGVLVKGLTTSEVTAVTASTATAGGTIPTDAQSGDLLTERGVCWKAAGIPTIADFKGPSTGTTGAFTVSLSGLTSGTLYYVRAYATNSGGTSYGPTVSFTSL
jgi:hypothetical protein